MFLSTLLLEHGVREPLCYDTARLKGDESQGHLVIPELNGQGHYQGL